MTGTVQNGEKSHLKYNNGLDNMCECCSGLSFFIKITGKIDKIRPRRIDFCTKVASS